MSGCNIRRRRRRVTWEAKQAIDNVIGAAQLSYLRTSSLQLCRRTALISPASTKDRPANDTTAHHPLRAKIARGERRVPWGISIDADLVASDRGGITRAA